MIDDQRVLLAIDFLPDFTRKFRTKKQHRFNSSPTAVNQMHHRLRRVM